MRAEFGRKGGPRDQFLDRVLRNVSVTDLQAMGLDHKQIRASKAGGKLPSGYEVHHKNPLKAGGSNEQDNLIFIRNDPDHKLVT